MQLPYKLFRKTGTWWIQCLGYEKDLKIPCQGPLRRLKEKIPDDCAGEISAFVVSCENKKTKSPE